MSEVQTLALGCLAGITILIGLPIGRLRTPHPDIRQYLSAVAVGVLLFLVWDVLSQAYKPVEGALASFRNGSAGLMPVIVFGGLFLAGISGGLMSLALYERWSNGQRPHIVAMSDSHAIGSGRIDSWSPARRLALLVAVGIGLHNFGEGLAIGASAAAGAVSLALVLVIGFALHNATEGFGIVAPLVAGSEYPSWNFLLLMGIIGGAPTIAGTAIGHQFTNVGLSSISFALAGGAIVYVLIQLIGVGHRFGRKGLLYVGVTTGVIAGFITDIIIAIGGG